MNKFVFIIGAAASLGASQIAVAQTLCSTATLLGSYGVQITGTRPAPSILSGLQATPGTTEQVVGVAMQNFDGAGTFTQIDNVKGSLSGITLNRAGMGTYSINSDCTGTYTVNNVGNPPIVNQLVIVDNGQGFLTAVTSPQPVMVTAVGHKASYPSACPVSTPPVLTTVVDSATNAASTGANGTIILWGQGLTPSGGNFVVFQQAGAPDVVLSEADGLYFWDYSAGQINASLGGRLHSGVWTATVHSACSGSPSNSVSLTIN